MASIFSEFKRAQATEGGYELSKTIIPESPPHDPGRLQDFFWSTDSNNVHIDVHDAITQGLRGPARLKLDQPQVEVWIDVFAAFWKVAGELLSIQDVKQDSGWTKVYGAWKELTNIFIKGYTANILPSWTIPCIYVAGKYLRLFAIKADEESGQKGSVTFNEGFQDDIVGQLGKNEKLQDAAGILSRIFTLCMNDRSSFDDSRKWGLYYATGLIFKTYFKLNSVGLCKNILRSIQVASADLPDLYKYPTPHVVTFKYYVGVINFLDENYAQAEEHLTEAWQLCHKDAHKNRELILTYLIPCHLLTTHTLPSTALLSSYPRLEQLFRPLALSIKSGDLSGFDAALAHGENEFVKRRIYLTLERGRDIALRNLFRKVFVTGGFEDAKDGAPALRRSRIPVAEFAAAMRLGNQADANSRTDMDEVECLLANMIYKGYMKGYISRERSIVVLSKGGAFPGTGV